MSRSREHQDTFMSSATEARADIISNEYVVSAVLASVQFETLWEVPRKTEDTFKIVSVICFFPFFGDLSPTDAWKKGTKIPAKLPNFCT